MLINTNIESKARSTGKINFNSAF